MTNVAEQVMARLQPVLAPRGFPAQRSSAGPDAVLFHCDGTAVEEVATRYPAWFADVARSYDDDVVCLDLWVQHDASGWSVNFENVTDEDLADAAGREAVARMHALADGPLDVWLDQVAFVLDSFFDSVDARR